MHVIKKKDLSLAADLKLRSVAKYTEGLIAQV